MSATERVAACLKAMQAATRRNPNLPIGEFLESYIGEPLAMHRRHRAYAELVLMAQDSVREGMAAYGIRPNEDGQIPDHPAIRTGRQALDTLTNNSIHTQVVIFRDFNFEALDLLAATTSQHEQQTSPGPSEEELKELTARLYDLGARILEMKLPAELKSALHESVLELLSAIGQYRAWGPRGVERAVGALMVAATRSEPHATGTDRDVLREAIAIGSDAATVVDVGMKYGAPLFPKAVELFRALTGS